MTTQGYTAVFQEELIRSYRAFLDGRRAVRPADEYREPTSAEWTEFQQHFQTRKLELGDCGRPYATPCSHEHACVRCPMLRVDPRARARLGEIIENLRDRIAEARANGWRGEIQGLQISLDAAAGKMAALEPAERRAVGPSDPSQGAADSGSVTPLSRHPEATASPTCSNLWLRESGSSPWEYDAVRPAGEGFKAPFRLRALSPTRRPALSAAVAAGEAVDRLFAHWAEHANEVLVGVTKEEDAVAPWHECWLGDELRAQCG